jgi:hypothetical protein
MRLSRTASSALIALAMAACGDDEAGIREGPASGLLADSAVLAQMRDTGRVNRLLYDPAPDLSLSSAQQRRPEIFRPPAPASGPPAAKDTARRAARTGSQP